MVREGRGQKAEGRRKNAVALNVESLIHKRINQPSASCLITSAFLMRYAVIQNGIVTNVVLIENLQDYVTPHLLIRSDTANIGDRFDGTNFTPSPTPKQADWDIFNRAFLNDAAYNRVVNLTTNNQAADRLEAVAVACGVSNEQADYVIFANLWNAMMDGVSPLSKPNSIEVAIWNNAALSAQMPFSFNSSGKIVI